MINQKNITKQKIKDLKKNIFNLSNSFSFLYENFLRNQLSSQPNQNSEIDQLKDNLVVNKIELYKVKRLEKTNFIEDCAHGHQENDDIKTAINAQVLFAIYRNHKKDINNSWANCYKDVTQDSKTFKKRMVKSLMHITAELTCVVLCFIGDVVVFAPLAVLIEVEGQWNFLDLCEEITHMYKERPAESWLILAAFFVLTIIFLTLTHSYIPHALFSKESERKNCLMNLEENILQENIDQLYKDLNSSKEGANNKEELKNVLNIYLESINNKNNVNVEEIEKILGNLKLHEKPILEAYEILNNALWNINEKNIVISSTNQILEQSQNI
jgi:hypothetical protein